jgi:hypothetical protein
VSTPVHPSSERLPEPARADAAGPPSDDDIPWSIPPAIREAQKAFQRDLPQLLRERPGQWVAYHGDKPIGFAATKTALCQECEGRGYEEYLVRCIEPYPDFDSISAL